MVYQGPSKGCNTCRWRRKKCDEARPSCMRCIKAGRPCGGYEHAALSSFRHHAAQGTPLPTLYPSTARKCMIPKRIPMPGTDVLPEDTIPTEVSQAQSNGFALRAFFYDYCVVSTNQDLSRGYFAGLESMAYRSGARSDLVKVCQAVAFGSHGKPLNRPGLVQKAELFYQDLLGSFAGTIERPSPDDTAQLTRVAILLGLYQIAMSTETEHGDHETHAKGLAALMGIRHQPQHSLVTVPGYCRRFFKVSRLFSIPALSSHSETLATLLLSLDDLWTESETSHSLTTLRARKADCMALHRRFAQWQDTRMAEFKPTAIGRILQSQHGVNAAVGCWPGTIDTYFDLYVAGVWNIFRTAQLLLGGLVLKLSDLTGDDEGLTEIRHSAGLAVQEMLSSVPYHLTDNLQAFVEEQTHRPGITDAGRHLGGLLLMHPLYIASQTPFLAENIRVYARECLSWIGVNMGLGQASLLATTPRINRSYLASACMLVWSGFLG